MLSVKTITLQGNHYTLLPLSQAHHDGLVEAVKDGELWKLWYTTIPTPENMASDITQKLNLQSQGMMLPFTVIDNSTQKIVGMTTYLNIDAKNRRLEIGSTWYRQSLHKSGINTEAKLLLLTHAFETLNCHAVELRTHFCNHQSRKAIERLGAKLDGILRHHKIQPNGTLRDTCVYSIIAAEWPTIKVHLEWLALKAYH